MIGGSNGKTSDHRLASRFMTPLPNAVTRLTSLRGFVDAVGIGHLNRPEFVGDHQLK
jgi:hypothetical protein